MKLHVLLGHPVSENFVSWSVSNVEEQLCIVFMYTGTPISSPVIEKCVHLKCFCVSCETVALYGSFFLADIYIYMVPQLLLCMMSGQPISDFQCQVSLLPHFPWQG